MYLYIATRAVVNIGWKYWLKKNKRAGFESMTFARQVWFLTQEIWSHSGRSFITLHTFYVDHLYSYVYRQYTVPMSITMCFNVCNWCVHWGCVIFKLAVLDSNCQTLSQNLQERRAIHVWGTTCQMQFFLLVCFTTRCCMVFSDKMVLGTPQGKRWKQHSSTFPDVVLPQRT